MATWTNITKNTATYSNITKNTSSTNFSLLLEDGVSYLLTENEDTIALEQSETGWDVQIKKAASYTNLTKN